MPFSRGIRMESTLESTGKEGPTDVRVQIPEPLHKRLSEHGRMSGEGIENVVIRALDAYFDARGPELEKALKELDVEDDEA